MCLSKKRGLREAARCRRAFAWIVMASVCVSNVGISQSSMEFGGSDLPLYKMCSCTSRGSCSYSSDALVPAAPRISRQTLLATSHTACRHSFHTSIFFCGPIVQVIICLYANLRHWRIYQISFPVFVFPRIIAVTVLECR